jgi:hypothetical protein
VKVGWGEGWLIERMATKFTKRVCETISEIDEISQNATFTKVATNRFEEFREIFAFRKIVSKDSLIYTRAKMH